MTNPETLFAWNGDSALAYQVFGEGSVDLLYMEGYSSSVDLNWENPRVAKFLRGLADHARVIVVDRRGYGASDRYSPDAVPTIESTTDDISAVMDAAGCERAVIFGTMFAGFAAAFFAAANPERTAGLVLFGTAPTFKATPDTPWGNTDVEWEEVIETARSESGWGTREWATQRGDWMTEREQEWMVRWMHGNPPGSAVAEIRQWLEVDLRGILPLIHSPTLVLADRQPGDLYEGAQAGRYIANQIAGSRFAEFDGGGQFPWDQGASAVLSEIGGFIAGIRDEQAVFDRVLATVLFTDIVDSTAQSAALGDRKWREVREQHDEVVRAQLKRFRGREIKTMGDGFLATFDGPARAVTCAQAITKDVAAIGIEVRAGLHTGEVEQDGDDVAGIGVAIGARVGAMAKGSEVLVSQTVKDLVAGSGLVFEDRGTHELKGVPEQWHIYAAI